MIRRRLRNLVRYALMLVLLASPVYAAAYDPGASAQEIKIGHINPYSGPASAYSTIGRTIKAYMAMLNEHGGINGRKLTLITYDDGYSPPKTVEQARRLVEQDQVLILFQSLGTPGNSAIHKYMNAKKVPQLFVATGATKWADPQHYPWTMSWQPNYQTESTIYARYILEHFPRARIGILYQNDDYGKDYLQGFQAGLGAAGQSMIASAVSYEITDPTVDSQVVGLKNNGADLFFNVTTPKFAAQAIRKAAEIGWQPTHILNSVSASIKSVLEPAGLDNARGILSATYAKEPNDPQWADDSGMQEWRAFMQRYYPEGSLHDNLNVYGYGVSKTLEHVLRQCGEDLTRANIMRQAANIKDLVIPTLLPGITVNTSPTDFSPIQAMQLQKFDGKSWVRFGEIIHAR